MKVKCLYNTGQVLVEYNKKPLGISKSTQYGLLEIGKEYLVMGIIIGDGILEYLIDDGDIISTCPYQLFEISDAKLSSKWFFKAFKKEDQIYPYQEAIWGYYELCFQESHYEQLIEKEKTAVQIYFRRKIEIEKDMG